MSQGRKVRVGAVNYLNTKPLVHRLEQLAPYVQLSYDLPSRLADDLAASRLDVALIPSIESFQDPTYTIVSDACIACRGPVLSVKLLSRKPVQQIRSLALDEGSRTSVALVQILLERRYGLRPRLEPLPIGASEGDTRADALLLIGDRAIHPPVDRIVEVWDLGAEWCRWSGLPFVFAMWTAREGSDLYELETALGEARDAGLLHLEEIAARESGSVGLTAAQCTEYLRDNLYFHLGPREQRGLELFYRHAARLGMAPAELELELNDCKATQ